MDTLCVSHLEGSATAEEVIQRLESLVSPYSADITSIRLFCHEHDRDSVLCSLDATANAPAIAAAIGGMVFGFSLVCRNVNPVRSDFRCPNRQNGMFQLPSCGQCVCEYSLKHAEPKDALSRRPPDKCRVAPQPDHEFAQEHVDDAR